MSTVEPRVSLEDKRRLRELTAELARVDLDRPAALPFLVPVLRELVGAYAACAYEVRISGHGISIPKIYASFTTRRVSSDLRPFQDYVHATQLQWGYDLRRPEKAQRNRVVATPDAYLLLRGLAPVPREVTPRELPDIEAYLKMLARVGWARPNARVLVCDGPRLLEYVGFVVDGTTGTPSARHRALLRALVPSLRRRLIAEARIGGGELWRSALEATLAHVGAPAFVLAVDGGIEVANRAGHEWLDRDRTTVQELLRTRPPALEVTPFTGAGQRGALCIYRGVTPGHAPRVLAAAARWQLTPRQTEVLGLLARGHTNARIATELACAEGTVEIHVSRILDRAQVASRAALIAGLLWCHGA
jgi:DNA-binding CsgD family transcriptional regulator